MRHCAAIGCITAIPGWALMCAKHWNEVPAGLQEQVRSALSAYKRGGKARPYILAEMRAKLAIAEAEGWDAHALRRTIDVLEKGGTLDGQS
jgi:hypothetical protein